jgi:hypothetical protein
VEIGIFQTYLGIFDLARSNLTAKLYKIFLFPKVMNVLDKDILKKIEYILENDSISRLELHELYKWFYDNSCGNSIFIEKSQKLIQDILCKRYQHLFNNKRTFETKHTWLEQKVPQCLLNLSIVLHYPRKHYKKDPFIGYNINLHHDDFISHLFYH